MNLSHEQNIAISIVVGFALVAGSIFLTGFNVRTLPAFAAIANKIDSSASPQRIAAKDRHIYGNQKADMTLVEFSDYQCPYCSQLHATLQKIVDESNGKINWEYRHFPLPIHKNAKTAAIFAECISKLSDNDAFWSYSKTLMSNQQSIDGDFLKATADSLHIERVKLATCVSDIKTRDMIDEDTRVAEAFGGNGTPFTVIVYKDGSTKPVSGALPYAQFMSLLK